MRPLSNSPWIARIDWIPTLRGAAYGPARAPVRAPAEVPVSHRAVAAPEPGADVELSVRLRGDGTQIAVVRHTVAEGSERRTVGIDAVIR